MKRNYIERSELAGLFGPVSYGGRSFEWSELKRVPEGFVARG